MSFIRSILVVLLALALAQPAAADMYPNAANAKLPDAREHLGIASYFGASQDLDPRRHLSNLVGNTHATICAIGDSTLTNEPVSNLTMDESQVIWGLLKKKLVADNPQIKAWSWQNRAIGGSNEAWPYQTAVELGITPPSWWTDPNKTWLFYIEPLGCDVLFYLFGTNASTAGIGGGSGPATNTQLNFNIIEGWPKKPNIVIITNKSGYYKNFSGGDDEGQSAHKAQAAYHRLFARTNAAGFASFPVLKSMSFGLIDLGRYFEAYVTGKDFSNQYLESAPSCIVSGRTLAGGGTAGDDASTVCHTPDGDYRLSFTLKSAGGTIIGTSGYTHLQVSASRFDANYHQFLIGTGGTLQPRYLLNGTVNPVTGTPQIGPIVATTQGADIAITIVQSGATIQYWIDGVLVYEIAASRFVMGNHAAPGMPVNINALGTPTTPLQFDVTAFWAGYAAPMGSFKSYDEAYGPGPGTPGCQPSSDGCQGGNSANHYRSNAAALDLALIEGMNFHVPSVSPAPNTAYNGGFTLSQEVEAGTVAFGASTSTYCMDGWACALTSAGGATMNGQRGADAPSGGTNSFLATVTAAAVSTAAGDLARIQQPLAAYDLLKLKWGTTEALPIFISYQLKTSVAGVYSLTIKNPPANNRYYATFCTVTNADYWTKCGFLIPGDTAGTWTITGSGKAFSADIMAAVGSSLATATPDAWTTGNHLGVASQTNLTQTNGATLRVANFKIEIGTSPTAFINPGPEELVRAQRFYRKTQSQGIAASAASGLAGALCTVGTAATAGTVNIIWEFGGPMNGTPAVVTFNPITPGVASWRNVTASNDLLYAAIDPAAAISAGRVHIGSVTTPPVGGNVYCIHARAQSRL